MGARAARPERDVNRLRRVVLDALIGWHDGRRVVHAAALRKWRARYDVLVPPKYAAGGLVPPLAIQQRLRSAVRDALKDNPETLGTFEAVWARNDRYDRGGILPPATVTVRNDSSEPERVITPEEGP